MQRAGFSLVEVSLVVLILALLATAFARSPAVGQTQARLAVASERIAAALRFARIEAMRTGSHHGARFVPDQARAGVYALDVTAAPPIEDPSVLHPLSKHAYDVTVGDDAATHSCWLADATFLFEGDLTPRESVAFSEDGRPVSPIDLRALQSGVVEVRCTGEIALVQLEPEIGRVTTP